MKEHDVATAGLERPCCARQRHHVRAASLEPGAQSKTAWDLRKAFATTVAFESSISAMSVLPVTALIVAKFTTMIAPARSRETSSASAAALSDARAERTPAVLMTRAPNRLKPE